MVRQKQYTIREQVLKDLKINKTVSYMVEFIKRIENRETPTAIKRAMGTSEKTTAKFQVLIPQIKEAWSKDPEPFDAQQYSTMEQFRKRNPSIFPRSIEDNQIDLTQILGYVDFDESDILRLEKLREVIALVPEYFWSIQHLELLGLDMDYLTEYHELNAIRLDSIEYYGGHYYIKRFRNFNRYIYKHYEVFFKTIDKDIPDSYLNIVMNLAMESFDRGDSQLLTRAKLIVSYKLWEFEGNVSATDGRYTAFKEALRRYTHDARVTNRIAEDIEKQVKEFEIVGGK